MRKIKISCKKEIICAAINHNLTREKLQRKLRKKENLRTLSLRKKSKFCKTTFHLDYILFRLIILRRNEEMMKHPLIPTNYRFLVSSITLRCTRACNNEGWKILSQETPQLIAIINNFEPAGKGIPLTAALATTLIFLLIVLSLQVLCPPIDRAACRN